LVLPYYAKKFSPLLAELKAAFQKNKGGVYQSTIQHFNKVWIHNYIQNIKVCTFRNHTYSLSHQSLDWKKVSLVFVGASPILETEIDTLIKNRHQFFILSSDTASYYLYKQNIKPDAILSIDSGRGTAFHFREDIPEDIPIITWLGGNRSIFHKKNPIYLIYTSYPLDQIMVETYRGLFLLHNPGLNISGMAGAIAEKMNVNDFAFAGISFSSYQGKTHCRGTGYEYYKLMNISRKNTLEMYTPGNYGREVSKKNQAALDLLYTNKFGLKNFSDLNPSFSQDFQFQKKDPIPFQIKPFLRVLRSETIMQMVSRELGLPLKSIYKFLK
jgi:hypothetical protein